MLLLYPPQLSFAGLSGYTVTMVGAAVTVLLYLGRLRGKRAQLAAAG